MVHACLHGSVTCNMKLVGVGLLLMIGFINYIFLRETVSNEHKYRTNEVTIGWEKQGRKIK